MRILDDKGRLFGKISIVDFVALVVLVLLVGWFSYSMFGKNLQRDVSERQQDTEIVVIVSGIRPSTAEAIARSDKVFELKTGARMGEVVDVKTEPADIWLVQGDGKWVKTQSEDRVDAFVTIRGTVRVGENVITMNGIEIRVGGGLTLTTKFAAFQGYVMFMDLDLGGIVQ